MCFQQISLLDNVPRVDTEYSGYSKLMVHRLVVHPPERSSVSDELRWCDVFARGERCFFGPSHTLTPSNTNTNTGTRVSPVAWKIYDAQFSARVAMSNIWSSATGRNDTCVWWLCAQLWAGNKILNVCGVRKWDCFDVIACGNYIRSKQIISAIVIEKNWRIA